MFVKLLGVVMSALLLIVFEVATVAPAAAAGSCSIRVPSKVAIASGTTVITAYPGSDCAASDMDLAEWNVSPSAFGDSFLFFAGSLSSSYTFYSSIDQVGVLRAIGTGASSSSGYHDLIQNNPTYVVKYATWAYSASSRSGRAV